jgi:hypothetical protein
MSKENRIYFFSSTTSVRMQALKVYVMVKAFLFLCLAQEWIEYSDKFHSAASLTYEKRSDAHE